MTCIVGIINKKENNVIIGGDSAGVLGLDISIRKDSKVFKIKDFIIGCCGSFRMMQLLKHSFKPPRVSGKPLELYMATKFVDEMRRCFKEGGYLYSDKGVEKGGVILVGYKNRLFKIESDFQVGETYWEYDAIGCGRQLALGSFITTSGEKPYNRALKALRAADYHNGGVLPPFNFVKT